MFKVRYSCICSLLVLISGLISCSKDKDVRLQPDTFSVGGLKVERSDRSYQLDTDIKTLDVSGQLMVESLRDVDSKDGNVVFKINTQCTDIKNNHSYGREYRQENSGVFPLIKLIPSEVLLLTTDPQLQCDFVLTAENGNRSTYTSSLLAVTLTGLADFSNYAPPFLNGNTAIYEEIKTAVLNEAGARGEVRLNCEDFGTMKTGPGAISLETLAQEYVVQSQRKPAQNCRLLVHKGDEVALSPIFQLNLPIEMPTVATQIPRFNDMTGEFREHTAMILNFFNPNGFPLTLTISRPQNSTYSVQPLMLENITFRSTLGDLVTKAISWQVDGRDAPILNDQIEIQIPAQGQITVQARVQINHSCNFKNSSMLGAWAFAFDLQSQFSINPYHSDGLPIAIEWGGEKYSSAVTPLADWVFFLDEIKQQNSRLRLFSKENLVQRSTFQNYYCKDI